ncbi:hypothetical protein SAY86_010434 [Trapa natans]|uniref:GATA-type domain-containing protein n=1 Tax=Trapa natans TaxID=22666 RepID=A0AAN7R470_TRANT|nr:hypothetical protein SAY86_010434 [Trapa natans]
MPDPGDMVSDQPLGIEPAADMASSDDGNSMENKRTCADCGTSKTPLWRGGPAGPKSLCNACGIRSRKRRRVIVGLSKGAEDMKKQKNSSISGLSPNSRNNSKAKFEDPWKRRLEGLERKIRSSSLGARGRQQQRRKLGEVERAAALLMALSCGNVYA